MGDSILVINAGSSSLKFQLFDVSRSAEPVFEIKGQIDGFGVRPRFRAKNSRGETLGDVSYAAADVADSTAAIAKVGAWLRERLGGTLPAAVGHRVVHGGPDHAAPALADAALVRELERYSPLAPLHQPANLAPVKALLALYPQIPQVLCFDTAFHRGHPELADRYALPESFYVEGVRRYGFHGLSYEFIASRLPQVAPDIARGRVIVAHLGSGASMCALAAGRSVDSTMGFSALDGLPMGTRPGQLDPGVMLYLMTAKAMSPGEIERMLYQDCGLKGLSGISNDVRELLNSADRRARLAIDYFTYRIAREMGGLAAALGGIDGLVFTAGIGENSPDIRREVCRRAAWLGVRLNESANARHGPRISSDDSAIAVHVIPTDEELMIARHTVAALGQAAPRAVGGAR
ncbi:MAG TPA: acetate/propionate family kinase [Alphaproteobacteria bacterium]|nr:acetate/propionate family kinase [Alphaproteobacteria bacterium]